jgi:hypothetical protein
MEELSGVPYTKYTTREIKKAFAGNEISPSLLAIDRMIYGGIPLESLDSFQELKSEAENLFRKKASEQNASLKTLEQSSSGENKINTSPQEPIAAKEFTVTDVENYANLLRDLPCPLCHRTDEKLNGTIAYTARSIIVMTITRKKPYIGCPTCLNRKNNFAIATTALLGWWGFPWGLIRTPQYIYLNFKAKKTIRSPRPNDVLMSLTFQNIKEIDANKDNKDKLKEIIKPKKSWWQP